MAEQSYPTRPATRPRFTIPDRWQTFAAAIDARTERPIEVYGFWTVCARLMTADEQRRAARLLEAFQALAEADPAHLDVELHAWATARLADVREGQWWRCKREGCSEHLRRVRQAEHRAWLLIDRAERAA